MPGIAQTSITINDIVYKSLGLYKFKYGTKLTAKSFNGGVYLNGSQVAPNQTEYEYELKNNITIAITKSGRISSIYIIEISE